MIILLSKSEDKRNQLEVVAISDLVPQDHLLRKVDKVLDLNFIYPLVEDKYCLDNGRPSIDPVILVKIILIQKLFGIKSMRQTIKEIETNVAYRWYLGYSFQDKIPHFTTFGKNYIRRFSDNTLFEEIFEHILQLAMQHKLVDTSALFIDSTHIKANANKHRFRKVVVKKSVAHYKDELDKEINEVRKSEGKKEFTPTHKTEEKEKKESLTDPDAGYYVKGEREKQFAYSLHACVDKNGFFVDHHVTPGNIHDSTQLAPMISRMKDKGIKPKSLAVDAGYKTPFNAYFLFKESITPYMPYTRPRGPKDRFRKNDFVYDEYYNEYICPANHALKYTRTDREGFKLYHSNPDVCKACPFLNKCTENKQYKKQIQRHIWQEYLEDVEEIRHTEEGRMGYKLRSQTIERRFGDAKEQHGMRWTKFRGLKKVSMETTLICACMNLKKLANWVIKDTQLA